MKYWMMAAALSTWACSDAESCQDSYYTNADGSNGYKTSCEDPTERDAADVAELEGIDGARIARGECVEQFATLYENGATHEVYRRRCEDPELSVSDDNLEGIDIGQLEQGILVSDCFIGTRVRTISVLGRPLTFPFTAARDRFNEMFDDDGIDPNVSLIENSVRPQQANNDVIRHEVRQTSHPDFPTATGVASCRNDNNVRSRCTITVHMNNIEIVAAALGEDPNEISRVTALHEFGHSVCLDHMNINSSAAITAMNSFSLIDSSRPHSDYFGYLASERNEVRSIVLNP